MIPLRPSPCLLRVVSWLLVALIPGLLMLATFGLERVEAGLRDATYSSDDVDEYLQQAEASGAANRVRDDTEHALPTTGSHVRARDTPTDGFLEVVSVPGLPTRQYVHRLANTEFRQTRHADRV